MVKILDYWKLLLRLIYRGIKQNYLYGVIVMAVTKQVK